MFNIYSPRTLYNQKQLMRKWRGGEKSIMVQARKIICVAVVDNELQRQNLIQCIEILKCTPKVINNTTVQVSVDCENGKNSEQAEKLIELFEHYWRHEITFYT